MDKILKDMEEARNAVERAKKLQDDARRDLETTKKALSSNQASIVKPKDFPVDMLQAAVLESIQPTTEVEELGMTSNFEQTKMSDDSINYGNIAEYEDIPKVLLSIDPNSDMICDGIATVQFEIEANAWTEADCICIVDSFVYDKDSRSESSLSNIFEFLEFTPTSMKVMNSGVMQGSVQMRLPQQSGSYRFIYAKRPWPMKQAVIMAVSEIFSLPSLISCTHPDVSSHRRRGIHPIDSRLVHQAIVEDLQHISVMNISFFSPSLISNRASAWIYHAADGTHVIIEAEVWDKSMSKSSKLGYGSIIIQDINHYRFQEGSCSITIDVQGRITCRLPYVKDTASTSVSETSTTTSPPIEGDISCKVCQHRLLDLSCIHTIKPLPSGQFDNMIHDFICCEDVNANPGKHVLTLNDLSTPARSLLLGSMFICISSMDYFSDKEFNPSSILSMISCKTGLTIADLFTVEGQAAAAMPYHVTSEIAQKASPSHPCFSWRDIVLMESCLLKCARCGAGIGEVLLSNDDSVDDVNTSSETSATIQRDDIRDVRLLRHAITSSNPSIATTSTEQLIARLMLHLNRVQSHATFCFYISSSDSYHMTNNDHATTQSHPFAADLRQVVICRIMNRDYAWAEYRCEANNRCPLQPAVKVSFCHGAWYDICSGHEMRIPLPIHEYHEILRLLHDRSDMFGNSMVFRGQRVSCLLQ